MRWMFFSLVGVIALTTLLTPRLDATEYDFCYKEVSNNESKTGCIIYKKAADSNWSSKEDGSTTTGSGETLRIVTLDVSDTDYANMTTTTSVEWFVNSTGTASAITTTALTP